MSPGSDSTELGLDQTMSGVMLRRGSFLEDWRLGKQVDHGGHSPEGPTIHRYDGGSSPKLCICAVGSLIAFYLLNYTLWAGLWHT